MTNAHLTIVPDVVDPPFLFHMAWDGTDDEPARPRTATLDDLQGAWYTVWRELAALEQEAETSVLIVQGRRYPHWLIASEARARVQTALCAHLDRIETAIAHARSVQS